MEEEKITPVALIMCKTINVATNDIIHVAPIYGFFDGEYEEDDRIVEVHPIDIDLFCGIPWTTDVYIMACYTQDFQFDGRKSKLFVTSASPNEETLMNYMKFLARLNEKNGWKIADYYPMQRKMVFKNDDFSLQIRLCCVRLPHDVANQVRYVEE